MALTAHFCNDTDAVISDCVLLLADVCFVFLMEDNAYTAVLVLLYNKVSHSKCTHIAFLLSPPSVLLLQVSTEH